MPKVMPGYLCGIFMKACCTITLPLNNFINKVTRCMYYHIEGYIFQNYCNSCKWWNSINPSIFVKIFYLKLLHFTDLTDFEKERRKDFGY